MFMASVGHECSDAPLRNAVWPPATYEDLALYATASWGHAFFLGNSCQCGYQGQIAIKKAAINSVSWKKVGCFTLFHNQRWTIYTLLIKHHFTSPILIVCRVAGECGVRGHRKYRVDSQQQGGVGLLYDDMSTVVATVFWMWFKKLWRDEFFEQ